MGRLFYKGVKINKSALCCGLFHHGLVAHPTETSLWGFTIAALPILLLLSLFY